MSEKDIDASSVSDDRRKKADELSFAAWEAEIAYRARSAKFLGKLSETQEKYRIIVLWIAALVPLGLLAMMFLELWGVTRFLHDAGDTPKAVFISVSVLSFVVVYALLLRMVFTPPEQGKEPPDLKTFRQIPPTNIDGN